MRYLAEIVRRVVGREKTGEITRKRRRKEKV
jgi:hypothetical protein